MVWLVTREGEDNFEILGVFMEEGQANAYAGTHVPKNCYGRVYVKGLKLGEQ